MRRGLEKILAMFLAAAAVGGAYAADVADVGIADERSVLVVDEYRPAEGSIVVGRHVYLLSPKAAGSLAEQLRIRQDKHRRFGATAVFGMDPLGRKQIAEIRVLP
jgi:hypothetical protein